MKTTTLVALAATLVELQAPTRLQAQRRDDGRVALANRPPAVMPPATSAAGVTRDSSGRRSTGRAGRFAQARSTRNLGMRVMTGSIGMIGGAYLGYGYGSSQGPQCRSECYFGSDAAVAGLLVGWVAGSALGAALPSLGSPCGVGQRIARGFAGSSIGFIGGGIALALPVLGLAGVVGAPIGAAVAQGRCA